jgi:benzoyl-CoA reductase/2-hydroxyglutaryl-CoA dehydratase subunit BcrC/BadD/HgdB
LRLLIMCPENRPVIGYMCSYFPGTLIRMLGFDTLPLFEEQTQVPYNKGVLPVTMCSYVRHCMDMIDSIRVDGVVLTNCCNSMQRLYDYIRSKKPELFCYMLDLPRGSSSLDRVFFVESIRGLAKIACEFFFRPYPTHLSVAGLDFDSGDDTLQDDTVYILGSAISPKSRQMLVEYLKPYRVKTNCCCDRDGEVKTLPFEWTLERDMNQVEPSARRLLLKPCARMDWFTSWFERLVTEYRSRIAGVIYIASQHCDSFLFRYPSIQDVCRKNKMRAIYLEEAYNVTGFNRVATRLEAFTESLIFSGNSKTIYTAPSAEGSKAASRDFKQRMHLVKGIVPRLPLEAIKKVVDNQVEIFTKEVWAHPNKIVWTNMAMTVEAFYAAGLIPVNMELIAGWLASLGLSREYIARSEGLGISSSLCSYHKAVVGLIEAGGIAQPRGVVVSSHVCDGGPGMAYYLAERYNSNVLVLSIPYQRGQAEFDYLLEQYKNSVKWIEAYTGREVTQEMLATSLELSNKARMYWSKALALRKGKPLFPGHLALRNLFGATFLFGSELGVEVAKSYYEQLQAMSEDRCEDRPDRRKRLLWIHFAPLYSNKIMEYLEKELNCWIVADIMSYLYWPEFDVDRPLESLVHKALSHFYLGDVQTRKEVYQRLIDEYNVDGIIHFMHNGCRAIPGSSWLVRDLARELKLPYLELTGDCIDPRGYSEEQFRLRLDAFRETLGRGKIVSGN